MTEEKRQQRLAYNRAYYYANKERLAVRAKERYLAIGAKVIYERRKSYMKRWYQENKEHRSTMMRTWYQGVKADPEKFTAWLQRSYATTKRRPDLRLAREKRWRKKNRDRVLIHKRVRYARERGAVGSYSPEQWQARFKFYGEKCAYCAISLTLEDATIDHIIPISCGGTNWASNIAPACFSCNSSKNNKLILPLWLRRK